MPVALIGRIEARIIELEQALGRFEIMLARGRLDSLNPTSIECRRTGLEDDLARLYSHRSTVLRDRVTREEATAATAAVQDMTAIATWAPVDHLLLAEQHAVEGQFRCEQQRELIAQLVAKGHDTTKAEDLLAVMEQILTQMCEHLKVLQTEHATR